MFQVVAVDTLGDSEEVPICVRLGLHVATIPIIRVAQLRGVISDLLLVQLCEVEVHEVIAE